MKFQFESLSDMLTMSGHGPYVWASYGVGLGLMAWLVFSPLYQKRRFLKEQHVLLRREQARQTAAKKKPLADSKASADKEPLADKAPLASQQPPENMEFK